MNTEVVNVKVAHIRPRYNNLKEWCEDSNNYYIGRKRIVFIDNQRYPKQDSPFANIYKVGIHGTLDEVLNKYYIYMKNRLDNEPHLVEELRRLVGKRLGCWCRPEKCHGDVLLYLINIYCR